MGIFDVFNANDIYARSLFSTIKRDDIFSDVYEKVTGRVHVDSAKFKESYRGPGYLHKPYMEIIGQVYSICIESDDDRIFPCGSKDLHLKDISRPNIDGSVPYKPQNVCIKYNLNFEEQAECAQKGLFSDMGDFDVPTNLVGNVIEIPMTVKYYGVYDTPIAMIEVLYPTELETDTRTNGYEGIFHTCNYSEEATRALEDPAYAFSSQKQLMDEETVYNEPEAQSEDEIVDDIVLTNEDVEDNANYDAVAKLFKEHTARTLKRQEVLDTGVVDAINDVVKAELDRRRQIEAEARDASVSDAIFGTDKEDNRSVDNLRIKPTYEDFKRAAMYVDENGVNNAYGNTSDNSGDNMNMNVDRYDMSDPYLQQTLSDPENFSDVTKGDQTKRNERLAQTQDMMADNMAMNIANNNGVQADVAGYGATIRKPEKANKMDFAARLLHNAELSQLTPAPVPQVSGGEQQFL